MKEADFLKTMAVASMSALCACTTEQADFNLNWQFWSDTQPTKHVVNLPHDAMQTEPRSNDVPEGRHNGFYPGNTYHYEKSLYANADLLQKHVTLAFEGVYRNSKVFVNGKEAGGYKYGYMPFDVCLDGLLVEGDNIIRVDVDNSQTPNSRWYSGAGIYRPLHLVIQEKEYIEQVKVSTLTISPVKIKVETLHQGGEVFVSFFDGTKLVAQADGDNIELQLDNAKLWSAESPYLYKAVVELKQNGKTIEKQEHPFGIRKITFSAQGFKVNGKDVLLKGGCLHHDNGILGAAEYDEAAYRKVAILKQYGFNAIRSSHNPLSEAMLKACDELGMYVMDELWDMWYITKTEFDYSKDFNDNYVEDIHHFVMKDFNHPSVIMYSIGNEVGEPAENKGVELAKEMIGRLHELDNSRPVTAGINLMIIGLTRMGQNIFAQSNSAAGPSDVTSEEYNNLMAQSSERMLQAVLMPMIDEATTPVLDALDIAGYNYASKRYEMEGTLHPDRIVVGSETFPYALAENWTMVEKKPYLIGDFMWTAWDYIGEIGLGAWYYTDDPNFANKTYPWKLNGGGALDLIGNPTSEAFLAKAIWQKDNKPYLAVRPIHKEQLIKSMWRGTNGIPSWSWQGCEGMPTVVEVFTSAPKAKLYINDKLIGEQEVKDYVASFDVTYEPGTLKAVTDGGEQILTSATGKASISIEPEPLYSIVNGQWSTVNDYKAGEVVFVNINLVGENGIVESKADRKLKVTVEGGELLGFGSQQLITEDCFTTGEYSTYYGQSQAAVRSLTPGTVKIHVTGEDVEASYELSFK
ncbi:MAG: DUF4982 domain-containing protein [Bacteroidaceae bacterium]|nr:DUF4982 domain-containing protein [Bacteroidaceae bacterium]